MRIYNTPQIGDRRGIYRNPEDCMSLTVLECTDVYETGPEEKDMFAEWELLNLIPRFGETLQAKFGEGDSSYGMY